MKFIYYNQWKSDERIIEIICLSAGFNYRAFGVSLGVMGIVIGFRLTKDFPKWDIDVNG